MKLPSYDSETALQHEGTQRTGNHERATNPLEAPSLQARHSNRGGQINKESNVLPLKTTTKEAATPLPEELHPSLGLLSLNSYGNVHTMHSTSPSLSLRQRKYGNFPLARVKQTHTKRKQPHEKFHFHCWVGTGWAIAFYMFLTTVGVFVSLFVSIYVLYRNSYQSAMNELLENTTSNIIYLIYVRVLTVSQMTSYTLNTLMCENISFIHHCSPYDPMTLMQSLAAITLKDTIFQPFFEFLSEESNVYVRVVKQDETRVYAAVNNKPERTQYLLINPETLELTDTPAEGLFADFETWQTDPQGAMQKVVIPWLNNPNFTQFWTKYLVSAYGIYTTYVRPFDFDNAPGYLQFGSNVKSTFAFLANATRFLREHGRVAIVDTIEEVVLWNSWNQPILTSNTISTTTTSNGLYENEVKARYSILHISEIDDKLMKNTLEEIYDSGAVTAFLASSSSEISSTVINTDVGGENVIVSISRIDNSEGLDLLVFILVVRSDFEDDLLKTRVTTVIVFIIVLIVWSAIAFFAGYMSVRPLKQLIPYLQHLSLLESSSITATTSKASPLESSPTPTAQSKVMLPNSAIVSPSPSQLPHHSSLSSSHRRTRSSQKVEISEEQNNEQRRKITSNNSRNNNKTNKLSAFLTAKQFVCEWFTLPFTEIKQLKRAFEKLESDAMMMKAYIPHALMTASQADINESMPSELYTSDNANNGLFYVNPLGNNNNTITKNVKRNAFWSNKHVAVSGNQTRNYNRALHTTSSSLSPSHSPLPFYQLQNSTPYISSRSSSNNNNNNRLTNSIMFNTPINSKSNNSSSNNKVLRLTSSRHINPLIFKEPINTFKSKACTLVMIEFCFSVITLDQAWLVDIIVSAVADHMGCLEEIGHNHVLVSFGAHASLPLHAAKACFFALDVYYRFPALERESVVCLVDTNEFMVGTCGACRSNARVILGFNYMVDLIKALWSIDCHVAASRITASHLPEHVAVPVECVLVRGNKAPVTLCELRRFSPMANIDAITHSAVIFRNAFFEMRNGNYTKALRHFHRMWEGDRDVQVCRLQRMCERNIKLHNTSPYLLSLIDVYKIEKSIVSVTSSSIPVYQLHKLTSPKSPEHSPPRNNKTNNNNTPINKKQNKKNRRTNSPRAVVASATATVTSHINKGNKQVSTPVEKVKENLRLPSERTNDKIKHKEEQQGKEKEYLQWNKNINLTRRNTNNNKNVSVKDVVDYNKSSTSGESDHPLIDVLPLTETELMIRTRANANDNYSVHVLTSPLDGPEIPLEFSDVYGNCWFRSLCPVGRGAFSVVYVGFTETGEQVAIKCIPWLRRDIGPAQVQSEITMAAHLQHPNVVQYISCCVTPTHIALVMEYVPGGTLYSIMTNFGALSEAIVRRFMIDIVTGLVYLHTGGVVHCDVKPQNMLLDINGICKLSDFGSTVAAAGNACHSETKKGVAQKNLKNNNNNNNNNNDDDVDDSNSDNNINEEFVNHTSEEPMLRGTALYMAPEVASGEPCTIKSDIYSLGISMLELLLGRTPWRWSKSNKVAHNTPLRSLFHNDARFAQSLSRQEVEPDIDDDDNNQVLSEEVRSFIEVCCATNPANRPSAQELLTYPFLV